MIVKFFLIIIFFFNSKFIHRNIKYIFIIIIIINQYLLYFNKYQILIYKIYKYIINKIIDEMIKYFK